MGLCMQVALREESVDRNVIETPGGVCPCRSLSVRRAWIEIVSAASGEISGKGRSP